jgi:hypothetical protein
MDMAEQRDSDDDAREKAYQEGQKLIYDVFKHITTLSTGAILILVAFLEKFFKIPEWKGLIAASFVGFILATISSVIAMIIIASSVLKSGRAGGTETKIGGLSILISIGSFISGVIVLVIFALKNFY